MRYKIVSLLSIVSMFFLISPLHSIAKSDGTFEWGRDNWSFPNFSSYFKAGYSENLTSTHQQLLKERLSHVDYRIAERIMNAPMSGACYGFSVTSVLACYDIFDPNLCLDDESLSYLKKFHFEDTITEDLYSLWRMRANGNPDESTDPIFDQSVIVYYQMLQSTAAKRELSVNERNMTNADRLLQLIDYAKLGKPTVVCYEGKFNGHEYSSGHAVLAYGTESGDWEFGENHYDLRILVYNPNNPACKLDYATRDLWQSSFDAQNLYCNTDTGEWYIPFHDISQDNGILRSIVSDLSVLNDGGIFEGTTFTAPVHTDVLTSNALLSDYTVHRIHRNNFGWEYTRQNTGIEHPAMFYLDADEIVEENFVCLGDSTGYQLEVKQPQDLYACIYYRDSMLTGRAANGQRISFDPSGIVEVNGDTGAFEAEMVFNQDYVTDWYDVTARGSAAEALLQMTPNGYLLTADDLHSTDFIARTCDERCAIRVNTQADAVLFTQTSSGELAAAVDADRDGFYETPIPSISLETLGDLDDSGEANAADASAILVAAAGAGLTGEDGLTDTQRISADVDGNGEISAADASLVLVYAAKRGLDTFTGTMYEFVLAQEDTE